MMCRNNFHSSLRGDCGIRRARLLEVNPPERISSGLVGDMAVHRRPLQRPSRAANHDYESHLSHVLSNNKMNVKRIDIVLNSN